MRGKRGGSGEAAEKGTEEASEEVLASAHPGERHERHELDIRKERLEQINRDTQNKRTNRGEQNGRKDAPGRRPNETRRKKR